MVKDRYAIILAVVVFLGTGMNFLTFNRLNSQEEYQEAASERMARQDVNFTEEYIELREERDEAKLKAEQAKAGKQLAIDEFTFALNAQRTLAAINMIDQYRVVVEDNDRDWDLLRAESYRVFNKTTSFYVSSHLEDHHSLLKDYARLNYEYHRLGYECFELDQSHKCERVESKFNQAVCKLIDFLEKFKKIQNRYSVEWSTFSYPDFTPESESDTDWNEVCP